MSKNFIYYLFKFKNKVKFILKKQKEVINQNIKHIINYHASKFSIYPKTSQQRENL